MNLVLQNSGKHVTKFTECASDVVFSILLSCNKEYIHWAML